jgi:exopolysaccharide biosynthesis operon protein EpsL
MLLLGCGMPNKSHALSSSDDSINPLLPTSYVGFRYIPSILGISKNETSLISEIGAPEPKETTIRPYVSTSMLYDSNFLRLPSNALSMAATGKSGTSEFVKQGAAGVDFDWFISKQHIIIKVDVNQNLYQNYSSLNYTGWDTLAQWNWQIKNNLSGQIGYTNVETIGNFDFINAPIDNMKNNLNYFSDTSYLFHPNGKIKIGFYRSETFYNVSRQISNNIEDSAKLELQYVSPNKSTFGLQLTRTNGQFPERQFNEASTVDNAYTRINSAVTWDWRVSIKMRIFGYFGYTQQNYEHISAENFSGLTGKVNTEWKMSEKTLIELSVKREISAYNSLVSNFLQIDGIWFSPTWQVNPKTALTFPITYQVQQFIGSSVNPVGSEQEVDKVRSVGLNLMYHPLKNVSADILLKSEARESNNSARTYQTQSVGVNLQIVF